MVTMPSSRLLRGGGRTHVAARRLVAVLAADRNERALHVRVFAELHVEHAPPLHARRRRVGVLARGGARLAADAARRSATIAQRVTARPSPVSPARCRRRIRSRRSGRATSSPARSGWARRSPSRTASPSGRTGRSISSVSGRMPCRSTARPRTHRSGVAISTRSPSAMPSRSRRARVHDHAAVAGDVVGDLVDQLHADVAAPRVLHAARR